MKNLMIGTLAAMVLASPHTLKAEGASWLRSSSNPSALNPKISVISDFVGQSGTKGDPSQAEDGFHLREVEIGIQADVDPYARADFFVGGMNDQGAPPELEEGFVTLLTLPWGLQARGGKFRPNFGRLNMVHPHELPQVDSPLALDSFLGEERLGGTGLELSRVFAPWGVYSEVSYALLQDMGDVLGRSEVPQPTTTITDDAGHAVEVAVKTSDTAPAHRLRNFAHVGKLRLYQDLTDTTNMDLGFSGALHEPKDVIHADGQVLQGFDRTRLAAVDLTLRWKPLAQGVYRSGLWRTEVLYADQSLAPVRNPLDGSVDEAAARTYRRGGYSYVEFQPVKRWRGGVRGDYVEDPATRLKEEPHITRAVAPYVTFTLSEFNRFRLQWTRKDLPGNVTENLGYVQWTIVLGPHGGHPF